MMQEQKCLKEQEVAERAKMSERAGGRRTVPQIFINGESVGGCDELYELERNNELNELIGIRN